MNPARAQRAQATVELALSLPLVVVALLGVVQVATVVRDQLVVTHAAREAARAGAVDPDPAAAITAARRVLPGAEVEIESRGVVGEPVAVTVRYRSVTDVPVLGPLLPDPELEARVVMRVER